jgi:hypothetical protein
MLSWDKFRDGIFLECWKRLTWLLTAKLLLALASTVILDSQSHGTHDHILLSDGSGSLHHSPDSSNVRLVVNYETYFRRKVPKTEAFKIWKLGVGFATAALHHSNMANSLEWNLFRNSAKAMQHQPTLEPAYSWILTSFPSFLSSSVHFFLTLFVSISFSP